MLARVPLVAMLAVTGLLSSTAKADPPPRVDEDEIDPNAGTKRPAAPDTRTGHFYASGGVAFTAPVGGLSSGFSVSDFGRSGAAFNGALGLGVSRYAILSVLGGFQTFGAPSVTCPACRGGSSFHAGLGASYHLAQGVAFDPWISYGVAFRQASLDIVETLGATPVQRTFRGLDFAKLAIGGEFYPIPQVGFGPVLGLDVGSFVARPAAAPGASVYGLFSLGLRISIDPLQRAPQKAVATRDRGVPPGPGTVGPQ